MTKIKKAIIPAAGLGTRFLPATKTVPKEMLTVLDAPTILYVVEEAISAGIEDIVLITGRGKYAIEDFFDTSYELEDKLSKSGKLDLLKRVQHVRDNANIISMRQKHALGLGHAVLCSEPVIGNNPFSVLLGDEITLSDHPQQTVMKQMVDLYHEKNQSVVSVMKVEDRDVHKYGIAEPKDLNFSDFFKVKSLVEKPSFQETSSRWALTGRYVLSGKIFTYLKNAKPGVHSEIQLTDSMDLLCQEEGFWALCFKALRLDAGDKFGYLRANVEMALRDPEIRKDMLEYLNVVVRREKDNVL